MSTEYRRGIPSTAHVEAATRLGLEWEEVRPHRSPRRWRFQIRGGELWCDFWSDVSGWDRDLEPLSSGRIADRADIEPYTFRPIRPDGTPVDWEVLDQVLTVTSAQPEPVLDEAALRSLILNLPNVLAITSRIERGSRQRDRYIVRVRLVDPNVPLDRALAAQIPRNVHVHCNGHGAGGQRGVGGTAAAIYSPTGNRDAVAPPIQETRRVNVEPRRFANVRPDRHGWRWWRVIQDVRYPHLDQTRVEFSHGDFRWMRRDQPFETVVSQWWADRTVIPTDEQGNPVSWESIGPTDPTEIRLTSAPGTPDRHGTRRAAPEGFFSTESPTPPRPGQFSNNFATPPLTPEGLLSAMQNYTVPGIHATVGTGAKQAPTETTTPLPRFTADELDDVDHSKTSKLDEVTLRRGKLPTVEQIAKYREVRARRTGTVADALKESRIDCEVAQYVLERWAGGLGDEESRVLIETASRFGAEHKVGTHLPAFAVDSRIRWYTQNNQTLDTSEKPSPTVQRGRQEAEERRQRLAELRQRLAAERAAQLQKMAKESEVSRFDLIEPDPQADPAASIRAWEARQAAAKVRPVAIPAKPAAALRRPAIEVVDAEADGLSRVEIVTALFGRALNGGC